MDNYVDLIVLLKKHIVFMTYLMRIIPEEIAARDNDRKVAKKSF